MKSQGKEMPVQKEPDSADVFAEGTVLTGLFGNHPKVKIIVALLSESQHDLTVTQIADLAGVHRSTVYDHLDDLIALDVVEQTREVSGSPLYQINRDDDVAKAIGQIEWELMDRVDAD